MKGQFGTGLAGGWRGCRRGEGGHGDDKHDDRVEYCQSIVERERDGREDERERDGRRVQEK